MIYVINYADENFEESRKYNTKTAYSKGKADKVIEFSPDDIDSDFKKRNSKIFSYKRGAGLWIWKPYIILKALEKINEGDYLFYCDAGAIFVNEIQFLIDSLETEEQSIMIFELPLLQRQFTKKETYVLMDFDDYHTNQCLATCLLIKKNMFAHSFIKEWLYYMQDERIVSPKHFLPEVEEFEDFYSHREDQSVLSILTKKHNLPVFRDPSNYGDRPWEYYTNHWSYNPKKYNNSNYPKIIISNRKNNPIKYYKKERFLTFLNRVHLYTYNTRRFKNYLVKIIKGCNKR
jgi:hypothetical protein